MKTSLFSIVILLFTILGNVFSTTSHFSPELSKSVAEILKRNQILLENGLKQRQLKLGSPVYIRIFKENAVLQLWIKDKKEYVLFRNYDICSLNRKLGPKLKQGDLFSPEGFYSVLPGQLNPESHYHLAFDIGYPNEYDRFYKRTGNDIEVHGGCVSSGCFAMTNPVIEQIYTLIDAAFRNGQKIIRVDVYPFFMTEKNMERYKESEWISFWKNLKEGYDYFEDKKIPPNAKLINGRYIIN
ncbi:MAG: L,D-transpeptidase family protein [Clostridiales bacterium]